mmetsp:Transcript_59779/g.153978  ORF Transcript_59779/g.153978 Transcript_59779/m.153978 type:complete len:500 (-) Transcript_59779:449-1948(-)
MSRLLVVALLSALLCGAVAVSSESTEEIIEDHKKDAEEVIEDVIHEEPEIAELDDGDNDKHSCRLDKDPDGCPPSSLAPGVPSSIYPGGETRCIFSADHAKDYAFRVYPGDQAKLVLYFQGGGSCFNEASTNPAMCKTGINEHPTTGIFNKTNPANPFQNYTIVQVIYCSGDLHGGTMTHAYSSGENSSLLAVHHGNANTVSVIEWARKNFDALDTFVVTGCSAGSLGAQMWANYLLGNFHYKNAMVLGDSYLPIFPGNKEAILMKNFGICHAAFLNANQRQKCEHTNFTITELFMGAIEAFPHVTFANLQSKADGTQRHFYDAVAWTMGAEATLDSEEAYYAEVSRVLESYNKFPNYVTYLVDGGQHCFLPVDTVFSANLDGTEAGCKGVKQGRECLVSWIGNLINVVQPAESMCLGPVLSNSNWHGTAYCSHALMNKTFQRGLDHEGPVVEVQKVMKTRTGMIIAAAVAGFLVLVAIVAAVATWCRRPKGPVYSQIP